MVYIVSHFLRDAGISYYVKERSVCNLRKKTSLAFSTILFCSLLLCLSPVNQASAAGFRPAFRFCGKTSDFSAEQEGIVGVSSVRPYETARQMHSLLTPLCKHIPESTRAQRECVSSVSYTHLADAFLSPGRRREYCRQCACSQPRRNAHPV